MWSGGVSGSSAGSAAFFAQLTPPLGMAVFFKPQIRYLAPAAPKFERSRPVLWCQGKAFSRPIPMTCAEKQEGARHGQKVIRPTWKGIIKRLNNFHHIKVSSLCPQSVLSLSSVPCQPQTGMVAGIRRFVLSVPVIFWKSIWRTETVTRIMPSGMVF